MSALVHRIRSESDVIGLMQRISLLLHCIGVPKEGYDVSLKRHIVRGTEQQNRFLHKIVSQIAAAEFVSALLKKEQLKAMYGPIIGSYNKDGVEITLLKSWADFSKSERSDLISHIVVYAAENGIEIAHPDEDAW